MNKDKIIEYRNKALNGDFSASEAADMVTELCNALLKERDEVTLVWSLGTETSEHEREPESFFNNDKDFSVGSFWKGCHEYPILPNNLEDAVTAAENSHKHMHPEYLVELNLLLVRFLKNSRD